MSRQYCWFRSTSWLFQACSACGSAEVHLRKIGHRATTEARANGGTLVHPAQFLLCSRMACIRGRDNLDRNIESFVACRILTSNRSGISQDCASYKTDDICRI